MVNKKVKWIIVLLILLSVSFFTLKTVKAVPVGGAGKNNPHEFKTSLISFGENEEAAIRLGETDLGFDAWLFELLDNTSGIEILLIKSTGQIVLEALNEAIELYAEDFSISQGDITVMDLTTESIVFSDTLENTILELDRIAGAAAVYGTFKTGDGGITDFAEHEADGTLVLHGAATVFDDVRIVPGSFDRPGVSDPSYVAYDVNGGGVSTYVTEWAKNDIASFTIQIPHSYHEGENIDVHLHWTPGPNGAGENGATAGWKVQYSWANINGLLGTMVTADLSDACDGTNHKHQMTPTVAITGTSKTISSMLLCNITRTDTGADDTWAGNGTGNLPLLLEVDFHFPKDTVGSRQISTK